MKGKKIIFICSRLDTPGGIERAVVNTANLFCEKGHDVQLLIADPQGHEQSCYPLHPSIRLLIRPFSFGIGIPGNGISRKLKLYQEIKALKQLLIEAGPDIVITTEYPFSIASVLTGLGKQIRFVAWEHQHHQWVKKNKFWRWLERRTYPKLFRVVCLNNTEAEHFASFATVSQIPNFIQKLHPDHKAFESKQILTIGWLIPRKGTDLLLPVAREVLRRFPDFTWRLVGDGELKNQVQDFIKKEKLEDRLLLVPPGTIAMDTVYRSAGLFVLPSRFEAFPMVLLEALSYGIPCISFDCPSGPSSIITADEDGILVEPENTQLLTAAIIRVLENEAGRQRMTAQALKNIRRFDKEFVYPMWETILNASTHI